MSSSITNIIYSDVRFLGKITSVSQYRNNKYFISVGRSRSLNLTDVFSKMLKELRKPNFKLQQTSTYSHRHTTIVFAAKLTRINQK